MVDIFMSGESIAIPPRIDTYEKVVENVFVSRLQQTEEREGNIKLAKFLAEKTNEPVFVLPHIQPSQRGSVKIREMFFPNGVKGNKNPDFYFRGRFVDGKCMVNITYIDDEDILKCKIHNRLKDAFNQSDDILLETPPNFEKKVIISAIKGKLNSSKHFHIVYVKHGDDFFVLKTKKPD